VLYQLYHTDNCTRFNAFPHLVYIELSAYFIEWYRLPPGSPARAITNEQLFYFYNLQPWSKLCPDDPVGHPARTRVWNDPDFPMGNKLYATLPSMRPWCSTSPPETVSHNPLCTTAAPTFVSSWLALFLTV
jgi:hypothetical protein